MEGEAFPQAIDLADAADRLEGAARALARKLRLLRRRDQRKGARDLLKQSYAQIETLRQLEGASQASRRALREAVDLTRKIKSMGGSDADNWQHLDPDLLFGSRKGLQLMVDSLQAPRTVRLPWPIRYDMNRFERLGAVAWESHIKAAGLEEISRRLEERARRAAALGPESPSVAESVADMDDAELAKAPRRKQRG